MLICNSLLTQKL